MKIRTRLQILVAAVMTPIVILAAINTAALWRVQRETHEQRFLERVSALRLALDTELAGMIRTLRWLSDSADLGSADWLATLNGRLQALLVSTPAWASISLDRIDGTSLARVGATGAPTARLEAGVIQDLATSRRVVVSSLVSLPQGGHVTFIAVPVVGQTEVEAILYITVPIDSWLTFLRSYPIAANATLTLNDDKGMIIARTLNNERWVGKLSSFEYLDQTVDKAEGAFISTGLEGQKFYIAFSRLHNAPWTLGSGVPERDVEAALLSATWMSLGGLIGAIGIAFFFAFVFGERIARTLDALAARARLFGAGKPMPPARRLPIREAEAVRIAFDASADQLHAREAALAQALNREAQARAEAEHASEAKDQFLAMLSHELRNPMSGIRSAVALLAMPDRSADVSQRALGVIDRQTVHLAQIVDDLMDVSRLNTGKVVLVRRLIDLASVVVPVVQLFRDTGRCSHLEIDSDLVSACVFADEIRLHQIVTNLLDNACKYTQPGGKVRVSLGIEAGSAVLTVADNGAGIPAPLLDHVFDAFIQGDRTLDRAQGGLGLGLTVVRRLVDLHGGSISVASDGLGQGAVFTMHLPLATDMEPVPSQPRAAQSLSIDIVVVDDSEDNRESVELLLSQKGHRVRVAEDGPSGVREILTARCDVALVDIGLPGFNGHEVARRVRSAAGASILLVALTGYGTDEDRQAAMEAGFDEFLVKPFDSRRFDSLVQSAIGSRKSRGAEG